MLKRIHAGQRVVAEGAPAKKRKRRTVDGQCPVCGKHIHFHLGSPRNTRPVEVPMADRARTLGMGGEWI